MSTAKPEANKPIVTVDSERQPKEHDNEDNKSSAELAAIKLLKTIVVTDCSAFTTSQRLKYLFTGIWILLLAFIFLANIVHLSLLIAQYFEHHTKVNVYFDDDPPTFPSFVICNCNPFRLLFENDRSFDLANTPQDVFESYDANFVKQYIGVPPDDVVVYAGSDKIPINEKNVFLDNRFFNCYTITHQFNASVDVQKLSIFMSVVVLRDVRTWLNKIGLRKETVCDGVVLAPFTSGQMPPRLDHALIQRGMPFDGGLILGAGNRISIRLTKRTLKSTGPPHVDCTHQKKLNHLDYDYSQLGCLNECKAMLYIRKCNCIHSRYQVPDRYRQMTPALSYCPRDNSESCQLSSKCEPDNNDEKKYIECVEKAECSHCKPRCEYDTYTSVYNSESMTSMYFHSNRREFKLFEEFVTCTMIPPHELHTLREKGPPFNCIMEGKFKNKTFSEWWRTNLLAIEVTFRTNQVEVWETSPVMVDVDLASGIGGCLGLYFGISISSIFEFASCLFVCAFGAQKLARKTDAVEA